MQHVKRIVVTYILRSLESEKFVDNQKISAASKLCLMLETNMRKSACCVRWGELYIWQSVCLKPRNCIVWARYAREASPYGLTISPASLLCLMLQKIRVEIRGFLRCWVAGKGHCAVTSVELQRLSVLVYLREGMNSYRAASLLHFLNGKSAGNIKRLTTIKLFWQVLLPLLTCSICHLMLLKNVFVFLFREFLQIGFFWIRQATSSGATKPKSWIDIRCLFYSSRISHYHFLVCGTRTSTWWFCHNKSFLKNVANLGGVDCISKIIGDYWLNISPVRYFYPRWIALYV